MTDTIMSFYRTIEAKSIHAYAAVVALGFAFTAVGIISHVQLAIATIFFGIVAIVDSLEGLSRTIERVDDRLVRVTEQLDQVNDDAESRRREPDDDQDRTRERERV